MYFMLVFLDVGFCFAAQISWGMPPGDSIRRQPRQSSAATKILEIVALIGKNRKAEFFVRDKSGRSR
jgi:hypothetical protein